MSSTAYEIAEPHYRLDYAENNMAKGLDTSIDPVSTAITQGTLRLGHLIDYRSHLSFVWRHWGCVPPNVISEFTSLHGLSNLDGFDELKKEDQARVLKACNEGHLAKPRKMKWVLKLVRREVDESSEDEDESEEDEDDGMGYDDGGTEDEEQDSDDEGRETEGDGESVKARDTSANGTDQGSEDHEEEEALTKPKLCQRCRAQIEDTDASERQKVDFDRKTTPTEDAPLDVQMVKQEFVSEEPGVNTGDEDSNVEEEMENKCKRSASDSRDSESTPAPKKAKTSSSEPSSCTESVKKEEDIDESKDGISSPRLSFSCRICKSDPCRDVTATVCGHLFCNGCEDALQKK
ncbi:hypothetical protein DENSPDRAFT_881694 [Dentipellis sp. KUC8613]|nr:hypothetical protein DENSPDRAFT_881694 [Dentipellis sp. KUC8613]